MNSYCVAIFLSIDHLNFIMCNTGILPRKNKKLFLIACASLLGLVGAAQNSPAQNAAASGAPDFDDSSAFTLWDGGFAATQKKFAEASAPAIPVAPAVSAVHVAPAAPAIPAAAAPAAATTLASIAASQVINWTFSLDNLVQRMGEVRLENLAVNNGGDLHYNGNLWARAYGNRVNADATITGVPFHEYTYGASVGADKAFQGRDFTALAGLMGDFSKTNRSFNDAGDGSSRNAGIGFYATLLSAEGWFADLAGRLDSLNTKFSVNAPDNDPAISGNYTTSMETLSLQAGRVFKRASGWWTEASLQAAISWAGSGACDTLAGAQGQSLRVRLDSARDLQYRAMLRFGRRIGNSRWYPYGKIAIAKVDTTDGMIYAGDTFAIASDYNGPRFECGLGTAYRIDEFNQVCLDYNYVKAGNYDSPWNASLGYRVLW